MKVLDIMVDFIKMFKVWSLCMTFYGFLSEVYKILLKYFFENLSWSLLIDHCSWIGRYLRLMLIMQQLGGLVHRPRKIFNSETAADGCVYICEQTSICASSVEL